jgi:hypothetical protein
MPQSFQTLQIEVGTNAEILDQGPASPLRVYSGMELAHHGDVSPKYQRVT